MKKEKGVTLIILVVYVILFSATIGLLATLSGYVYNNLSNINSNSVSSEEFNKFNLNFVKDVKENKSVTVKNETGKVIITFANGTQYTYVEQEKTIYKDKAKIANNIAVFTAQTATTNSKNTIKVSIKTGKDKNKPNFSKEINYVLRYW